MKTYYYLLLGISLLLFGCNLKKEQPASNDSAEALAVINLSEKVEQAEALPLSEAASQLEIVPLETTNESIVGDIHTLHVTEHDIWIKHDNEERLLRFSRSGKYLNKVGKIGQGPEEYTRIFDFVVDEKQQEVYIVSTLYGIKVYDFEGKYKRRITKQLVDEMFSGNHHQVIFYNQAFLLSQNAGVMVPIANPKDSLWSVALVDNSFEKEKLFKNPAHIGKEELLVEERCKPEGNVAVNYLTETQSILDTYNQELTLKYPDTDTIYQYDAAAKEFIPQYAIFTNEPKGDYELTHRWIKERAVFGYFTLINYYPTKDYIYLVGSKGEDIHTYCYNKKEESVKRCIQKGEIQERKLPWFSIPHLAFIRHFVLNNDLAGGDFKVDYRTSGKYWVSVMNPFGDDNRIDSKQIENATVKDEAKKRELLQALNNATEESNPILAIATLK